MRHKLVLPAPRPSLAPGLLAALMATLVLLGAARAEVSHPPILLEVDRCADVPEPEVRRLLTLELGTPLVNVAGADLRETTRVAVGCVAASTLLIHLEVRDPTTGKGLDRMITLAGVPRPDQARLVAIAAAELVAASWSELEHASQSAPHAVDATASRQTRDLALSSALRHDSEPAGPSWRVFVVGTARSLAKLPRLLPGGGLAAERMVRSRWGVGGDLIFESAEQPTALGNVDSLLLSAALTALVRGDLGRVAWEAGAGGRLGVARLTGQGRADATMPVRAGAVTGPWGGPLGVARALLPLPRHLVIALGAEVGYATAGVRGRVQGAPDVAVDGAWWSAVLGVGLVH